MVPPQEKHAEHARSAAVLAALSGAWSQQAIPKLCKERIALFLEPSATQWNHYPFLEFADEDPVLPDHVGHYMRETIRQEGFQVESVAWVEQRARLRVKEQALDCQLSFLSGRAREAALRLNVNEALRKWLVDRIVEG